ncbi:hypothetical protein Pfo_001058 [Paulownia fortunei]|nr:hypothetical protein Pfo_001058 [Paulownia fortunei]
MALAEARAAWQRTANRCLVQEDAKRAPKLACCSSVSPSVKQADTGPTSAAGGQDIPSTVCLPLNLNPSYSNFSPNSKWWLQQQPNCGYQKGLMDEQFNSLEGNMVTSQMHESSGALARNEDDPGLIDETTPIKSSCDIQCRNIATGDKIDFGGKAEDFRAFSTRNFQDPLKLEVKEDVGELKVKGLVGCEISKNANDLYFDSESSWIGAEKNTPWWRTADTDELASLVARRSLDHIENCDLPRPQNTHVKKDVDVNICCFGHDGISGSLLDPQLSAGSHHHSSTQLHTPGSLTAESACQTLSMSAEDQLVSSTDKLLRDIPTHERMPEMHKFENVASKAQLMEALCHSQTRAREAEKAAKQACAEKEHVVKLVFRQASQLFAYKQWLQLLQLESMYLQFINNKSQSVSVVFPVVLPSTPQRTRKIRKSWHKSSGREWAKRSCPQYDVSKYAVIFALGLGLAGAGFLLGWTIGWMLPTW